MSKESQRLLEAMSALSDGAIDCGEPAPRWGRRAARWCALAACLCLVAVGAGVMAGIIPLLGGRDGQQGGGGGQEATFMAYAGPVLPLTLKEENPAVAAERDVTLDFAPWAQRGTSDILVTDTYTLTNTSQEDQTLTVLYPFVSGLQDLEENRPALTADGAELETTLRLGAYAGGFEGAWGSGDGGSVNLDAPDNWTDYQALLADGSYLETALGPGPDVSGVPVIVYKLTNPYSPSSDPEAGITNPTLRVTFDLDYNRTTVLTYGFHGASYDQEEGTMVQDFTIPQPEWPDYGAKDYYLLVLGEDVENMTIQGYANGSLDGDAPRLEGCGATVERYESDLDTALRQILPRLQQEMRLESVDFELYYRAFLEQLLSYGVLSDHPVERYDAGWLENIEAGAVRVCWLEGEITLPAGGTVNLTAAMTKEGSYNFTCAGVEEQGMYHYDLATRLGSNLTCTSQTASLEDRGYIEIVRQNFGFDLEAGITAVTLDGAQACYYLEVRRTEG